jgi:hypothetical protein
MFLGLLRRRRPPHQRLRSSRAVFTEFPVSSLEDAIIVDRSAKPPESGPDGLN